jgi:hypothetical protein
MEPLKQAEKKPISVSDFIYLQALEFQGEKGEPIFFGEISFFKAIKKGNSIKVFKTHHKARKMVFSGKLETVKADKTVLLSCLNSIFDKKKAFEERKTGAYFIESFIVEKFLGYGFKSE